MAIQGVILLAIALSGFLGPAWPDPWLLVGRAAGGVLILAGLVVAVLGLTGLRENLTANPRPREDGRLIETGAYGLVRHPIYTGLVTGALGWSLVVASPATAALAILLGVFFDVKARREEAWLLAAYPGYAAYRRRVRKLIPFVY